MHINWQEQVSWKIKSSSVSHYAAMKNSRDYTTHVKEHKPDVAPLALGSLKKNYYSLTITHYRKLHAITRVDTNNTKSATTLAQ